MKGLRFDLEALYFACFRNIASTSVIQSYNIPPFTTIRGLIANCMGLPRFPDYKVQLFLQEELKIGVTPTDFNAIISNKTVELAKILKQVKRETIQRAKLWSFPSSPMFREFLVNPSYRCYLIGEDETIEEIEVKLEDPERPLYIGQSDDLVNISNISMFDTEETKSKEVWSVIEGVYPGCEIVRIPYKFRKDGKYLFTKTVSIPFNVPIKLDEKTDCYTTDKGCICAY